MALDYIIPEFEVVRNDARCTRCRICESQCANGVHTYNADGKVMVSDESKCVNCQRCVSFCPTHAIKIVKSDNMPRVKTQTGPAPPSRRYTSKRPPAACC